MAGRRIAVVACGAPLAARCGDVVDSLADAGWQSFVVATPDGLNWLDRHSIEAATGSAIRSQQREPGTGTRTPLPDAVLVCPATFNTVNKLAAGSADTYALSCLCEWLGASIPMFVVLTVNDRLWGHPIWSGNLARLAQADVTFVDPASGRTVPLPTKSGTGDQIVADFDPQWLVAALPVRR